jgi:hypothetical protein
LLQFSQRMIYERKSIEKIKYVLSLMSFYVDHKNKTKQTKRNKPRTV